MKSTLSRSACDLVLNQMANALAYLHFNLVVHNDVKPENIIHRRAVLIDFGAAFNPTALPQEDFVSSGTPSYVSPEFLQKGKGEKGDVWAFGAVMLFVLGWVALPDGDWFLPNVFEEGKGLRQMKDWLEAITRLGREVADKHPLLAKMLEADPDDRIGSREMQDLIQHNEQPRTQSACLAPPLGTQKAPPSMMYICLTFSGSILHGI